MALPILNEAPKYTLTIPSSGKKAKFRPYLVKEEKVLLIAAESKNETEVIDAIQNTVAACLDGSVDVSRLTTFDLEYIFIQLRAKSTGEVAQLIANCTHCSHGNEQSVDLTQIDCSVPKSAKSLVSITDKITVEMKYPSYADFDVSSENVETTGFDIVAKCIDTVMTEDERIEVSEEPIENVITFLESMTQEQFTKIADFLSEIPAVKYNLDFECSSCGEHNNVELKGLQSFF